MADPNLSTELTLEESKTMTQGEEGNQEDHDRVSPFNKDKPKARRRDHLASLIMDQKAVRRYSMMKITQMESKHGSSFMRSSMVSNASDLSSAIDTTTNEGVKAVESSVNAKRKTLADARLTSMITGKLVSPEDVYSFPVEVRIKGLNYQALVNPSDARIKTVYNSSVFYSIGQWCKGFCAGGEATSISTKKDILHNIHLVLKPGTQTLILGTPGSGKSSLLKAIAGRLSSDKSSNVTLTGCVEYNGKAMSEDYTKKFHIDNVVSYIDQLDRHAPRLSVEETFEFAYQCKTGGINPRQSMEDALIQSGKKESVKPSSDAMTRATRVSIVLESLGLSGVKDTFVGDSTVRGVSGGQRRRVTAGEMLMDRTPLLCGDEISTGLDAASTYDMVDLLTYYGRAGDMTRVIALLQPSPETVSLFDGVIVLAEGKVLFSGPIEHVQNYFQKLGYMPPEQMDVADFLQILSTADAAALWTNPGTIDASRTKAYSVDELAELFIKSQFYANILEELESPHQFVWDGAQRRSVNEEHNLDEEEEGSAYVPVFLSNWRAVKRKYANSFSRAIWLNLMRSLLLWIRDRRVLIANFAKNAIMGISVGGVFYQTEDVVSILGLLFQSMLFIMLGASTASSALVDDRVIFRKHYEANFFSPYPFVIGRTLSQMPQIISDVLVFGSILYFMTGLNLTVESYLTFIAILICFSILINQIMAVFAASLPTKSSVQAMCSILLLFCILFGGFIVPPNVIPVWWVWMYWWNPFAWAYRALVVLEFQSDSWSDGNTILITNGFVAPDGQAFQMEWVWYYFAYMAGHYLICVFMTAWCLGKFKGSGGNSSSDAEELVSETDANGKSEEEQDISFLPANLTFEDISYEVPASKGSEKLRLLNNINGVFQAGRMCALMGSSGAGKTTLMDVVAVRKSSGTVTGEVRINGFLQDIVSFRRASGYVEQFDVQSPELTVFETILYSARLRLEEKQVKTDEEKVAFVNSLMKTLELKPFGDSLVGTSEDGGLSFEQKKRLSIAVELAASPSIIFLDEPTSGLDARSAFLVVKLLRKIATQGRTICATIHQPSSAVFEMFDDLLLLKKGGEVVFFGELGDNSHKLVEYFEDHGAKHIQRGENPANWVLTVMTSGAIDYAAEYLKSELLTKAKGLIAASKENPSPDTELSYDSEHARLRKDRYRLTSQRLMLIYWRSPNYNLSRMTVAAIIAAIMGSVLIADRSDPVLSETDLRAQFATMFLSFIIMGIMSIFSVLPVMLSIRDMFYRHRAAGMIGSGSLAWALGSAEKGFILVTSTIFCVIYLLVSFDSSERIVRGSVAFWGFFTFNIAIYSYFGQAFVCFFEPMATAQILASVFIGLNNFFSGLIVRPQYMTGLFAITYWITPGHYVYEGMITAMYSEDNRTVTADNGTDFYNYLDCGAVNATGVCEGTVEEFMDSFFGGLFQKDHTVRNFIILGAYLIVARVVTFVALNYLNFSSS